MIGNETGCFMLHKPRPKASQKRRAVVSWLQLLRAAYPHCLCVQWHHIMGVKNHPCQECLHHRNWQKLLKSWWLNIYQCATHWWHPSSVTSSNVETKKNWKKKDRILAISRPLETLEQEVWRKWGRADCRCEQVPRNWKPQNKWVTFQIWKLKEEREA